MSRHSDSLKFVQWMCCFLYWKEESSEDPALIPSHGFRHHSSWSVGAELCTLSIDTGSQCGCRIVHDLYRFWDPGKKLLGTSDSRSKILLPAYTSLRDEKLGQNRCLQYMFLLRPPSIGFVLRTKHHRNNSFTVTHKQRAVCLPRPFVVLISSSLGWGKAS